MSTWHQEKNGMPVLCHPTLWSSYNPSGHLSVMRHQSKEDCIAYCNKTGDTPLAPTNSFPIRKKSVV